MDNTDNKDINIMDFNDDNTLIINSDMNDIDIINYDMNDTDIIINDTDIIINDTYIIINDTDIIINDILNSNSNIEFNTDIKYENNNNIEIYQSKIINFFNNIIINQNKNKPCRSANISINKESYLRVTNNVDNYCCTIQTGSGWSKWFYFNSSIDGIGFIVNANESWSWQKKSDFELI